MKCVYSVNEFSSNSLVSSELWGETMEGKSGPLLPIIEGIKATLTVTKDGYTGENNAFGEIVRQGKETDVFAIYDTMRMPVEPLQVVMPIFVGMFSEFERIYGHGRIERDETRRWLAYVEHTGSSTSTGLTEYEWANTLAVHSLHIDKAMSNGEVVNFIASFVEPKLKACEHGTVTGVGIDASLLSGGFGVVRMHESTYKDRFEQRRLLTMDAAFRRTDISEDLEEPVRYIASGLFNVEKEVTAVG